MLKESIKRLYLETDSNGNRKYSYAQIGQQLGRDSEAIRNHIRKQPYYRPDKGSVNQFTSSAPKPLPERTEIRADGTQISERILRLTDSQRNNPDKLMTAHGFSPNEWTLERATSNLWHQQSDSGVLPLYQSKITVKPKLILLDLDALAAKLDRIKPIPIHPRPEPGQGLLEVFLTDQHFGLGNDYSSTLSSVIVHCMDAKAVVIVIGSDAVHVDNVSNTTVKGTQLEPIDLNGAWEQMYTFYFSLIHACLTADKRTKIKYIPGNHDSTLAWTVVKALEKALPDAEFDTSHDPFKALRWHDVAIGWTHGDKGKKTDFDRLFHKRFPHVFGTALCSEIHFGHIHTEGVKDNYGTMVRSLPTGTVASQWTHDSGYESAQAFQLFRYSQDRLTAIHYV